MQSQQEFKRQRSKLKNIQVLKEGQFDWEQMVKIFGPSDGEIYMQI